MSMPITPITNVCHGVYQNVSTNLYLLVITIQTSRTPTSITHSPIYSSGEEQEKQEQKQTHEQEDIKNPNKKSSHPNINTPRELKATIKKQQK
eukprot:354740_1